MRRLALLSLGELIEHWTLRDDEAGLVAVKHGARPSHRHGSSLIAPSQAASERAPAPGPCSGLWAGDGELAPVTAIRSTAERSLADAILMAGDYRQHGLPEGAMLSERPIAETDVHLLLEGLLLIEIDQQPAAEAGPGAIFDPAMRTPYSKAHVTVRAETSCRLAVLPRDQLDSKALLGVATEQTSRLNAQSTDREPPGR